MEFTDPVKLAEAAEAIYNVRYRESLAASHPGQFVVIDMNDEEAYVGEFPEEALKKAKEKAPDGVFHLIRIGAPGAFKVSYVERQASSWGGTLRSAG